MPHCVIRRMASKAIMLFILDSPNTRSLNVIGNSTVSVSAGNSTVGGVGRMRVWALADIGRVTAIARAVRIKGLLSVMRPFCDDNSTIRTIVIHSYYASTGPKFLFF